MIPIVIIPSDYGVFVIKYSVILIAIIFLAFVCLAIVIASALSALVPHLVPGVGSFVRQWLMRAIGILPERKMTWGTVYDSNTKRPIPFAKVQLLDAHRRVLETRVADERGRYGFLSTPASLIAENIRVSLVATHVGYAFPSKVSATIDHFVYNNLYLGGLVQVNDKQLINFDIPMDPTVISKTSSPIKSPSVVVGAGVAATADVGFWLGAVMVPLSFILAPNPFTFGILCLFLGTASLRIFGISEHPYGTVTDSSGHAMPFALVTLNDAGGKRIAFAVSDERGRYFIVSDRGEYELSVFTPATVVPPRKTTLHINAKKGWITRELSL